MALPTTIHAFLEVTGAISLFLSLFLSATVGLTAIVLDAIDRHSDRDRRFVRD